MRVVDMRGPAHETDPYRLAIAAGGRTVMRLQTQTQAQ